MLSFVIHTHTHTHTHTHAPHLPSPPCLVSSQAGFGMQCYCTLHHARWPQCVYRGRVQDDPVYLWSSLHAPPRLHRQLIYTYGSSPHNLTTFRFRHWLSSAPPPPASGASSAFSSSAFSTSRRSFLPPPVPLLHYFLPFMRSHDVASAAARLGSMETCSAHVLHATPSLKICMSD